MKFSNFIKFAPLLILFITYSCGGNKSDGNSKPTETSISIYLVAEKDSKLQGKDIGCGDMLVEIKKEVTVERSILEAAHWKTAENQI